MDRAAAFELKMLSYQQPMNDVIDRGDSPVQLLYHDTTVFMTGGAGFIGKQLIEKLFRSCAIKKMYVLMRAKKGKTIHERLQVLLSDPVYDLVHKKKPQFAERIVPMEGNVAEIRLGLSDDDWTLLTQEVDVIFHLAATVRFNAPLREAVLSNVRGTRETITLSKECANLKHFVHVSTAYSCATRSRIGKEVFEKFYPCPLSPNVLISLVEELNEKQVNGIAEYLLEDWPNTYAFTKGVAEELIRTSAKDLPACIVRPPIVIVSYCEPAPGWLDMRAALSGASGLVLGVIIGVIHVFRLDTSVKIAVAPVDFVNNAIIGAAWDANERKKTGVNEIPIYTVTSKDHLIQLGFLIKTWENSRKFASDKAVYLAGGLPARGIVYWFLAWLLHYIPTYLIDVVCAIIEKRPKGIKSFVDIYKKYDEGSAVLEYFVTNEWQFRNENLVAMLNKMSEADKAIYNCDMSKIDFTEFILIWGLGIRKYIIKDGLNKSNLGYKKQQIFRFINYILLPLYLFTLLIVLWYSIRILGYVINI